MADHPIGADLPVNRPYLAVDAISPGKFFVHLIDKARRICERQFSRLRNEHFLNISYVTGEYFLYNPDTKKICRPWPSELSSAESITMINTASSYIYTL